MIFRILLIAFLLIGSGCKKGEPNPTVQEFLVNQKIVYVTESGSKYHRNKCQYLSKSRYPMMLRDAKLYYTACKVCEPKK